MPAHRTNEIAPQSSAPKPWEDEGSFQDALYEWMQRAPWLALSAIAHGVLFAILMVIPWDLLTREEATKIVATLAEQPEEIFPQPEPEEPEAVEDTEVEDEPVLQDVELAEPEDEPFDESAGDPEFLSDAEFEDADIQDIIGIGPGGGDKFGDRGPGGRQTEKRGGGGTQQALKNGLEWLKNHQSPDGSWDCDEFDVNCGQIGSTICDGAGVGLHDVGVTGLALLAFLGADSSTRHGPYRPTVAAGIQWLIEQQDPDTGLIGEKLGHAFVYNHGIATLALCEAYYFSGNPILGRRARDAVNLITRARNPYAAWRYDYPPIGENDSSVTGWMVFALKSAEEAGLEVDPEAYSGSLTWFDEVTDPASGRVGYMDIGSPSSRIPKINDHFPTDKGESMTAVGLLCRFFLGQDPDEEDIMPKHAELMRQSLPEWDPEGFGCDMYYWYYGSYAMFQMGGTRFWEPWNKAMKKAVVESQRRDGDEKGSWDPVGPWGFSGGRVYSTALMTLCLEVYFRYTKVLGSR